jgi:hypothetical protein
VASPMPTEMAAPSATSEPATAPVPPPATPAALAIGTASPDPSAPLPAVKITAPRKDEVIPLAKSADFAVKLDVKNWPTATGSSHVHLILDNRPYKPLYDTKAPVKLSELSPEPLSEGQHVLVAFPSRANHESVKTKDALAVVEFYVGKKAEEITAMNKPMLIFSRPKGQYDGALANHVLVDFYVANGAVGEGKGSVHMSVTGPGIDKELAADAVTWGPPFFLDHLQNGAYTIKLDLRDKDGKAVPGPWNSTTRTIKIDRDAATPDPHAGHAPSPPAAPQPPGAASAKPPAPAAPAPVKATAPAAPPKGAPAKEPASPKK